MIQRRRMRSYATIASTFCLLAACHYTNVNTSVFGSVGGSDVPVGLMTERGHLYVLSTRGATEMHPGVTLELGARHGIPDLSDVYGVRYILPTQRGAVAEFDNNSGTNVALFQNGTWMVAPVGGPTVPGVVSIGCNGATWFQIIDPRGECLEEAIAPFTDIPAVCLPKHQARMNVVSDCGNTLHGSTVRFESALQRSTLVIASTGERGGTWRDDQILASRDLLTFRNADRVSITTSWIADGEFLVVVRGSPAAMVIATLRQESRGTWSVVDTVMLGLPAEHHYQDIPVALGEDGTAVPIRLDDGSVVLAEVFAD